jgi:hypothetical protein
MRTVFATIAVLSLFTAVALVPVLGGVLIGATLVGVAGLALTGVLAGLEDTTVAQRNPEMDPTRWRDGA